VDLFSKLEKLSEKYIEGFFKNKFSGRIQPVELARHLAREMRDKKTVSLSKVYVPNRYQIILGEEDWATFSAIIKDLTKELQEFAINKAKEKNYSISGLPVIEFLLDKSLKKGTFMLESGNVPIDTLTKNQTSALVDKTPEPATIPKACLTIDSGEYQDVVINLFDRAIVIGRQKESDIMLKENNVSRRHAKIEPVGGVFFITDLDSTNGTFVNGERVQNQQLTSGDAIKIGTTLLQFRMV